MSRAPSPAPTARALARAVLGRVERDGAYAGRALAAALARARALGPPDRALGTELVYGVLRRRVRLDRALDAYAKTGTASLDPEVRIALRVAAYQILFLDRVPDHAAVNDAVEACKSAGGRGVAGFANALLRRLARAGEPPLPDAAADPAGYLEAAIGFPAWLARLALAELPVADALAFGEATAAPAPVTLRANTGRLSRDALLVRLGAERPGAALAASAVAPDAILARRFDAPATTAAWREGLFAIQDAGAQVVAELCGAAPGERILDACAGVGGKTAHLLALAGDRAEVDAVDLAAAKLEDARRTLDRLGLRGARLATGDLTRPLADPTPRYHRILLDAPCSGLGVLRRHPEALLRRTPADLGPLAAQQRAMLAAVAPALLPGGLLTYAVCTFERQECDDVVAAFLRDHPRFEREPATAAGGRVPWRALADAAGALRTWPQRDDADAFFAVRLRARG
ncbi:MAG TPA: 16S rRNA (cytosine(967)-C(5))-methyltransferase RsmB [Polyangia bacterium]|nr:16S rRNA (cytosine(967)-C(5))-methyltransferase RsmB [Polyangia bacterium]